MSEVDRVTPEEHSHYEIENKFESVLQTSHTRRAIVAGAAGATGVAITKTNGFNRILHFFNRNEPQKSSTSAPISSSDENDPQPHQALPELTDPHYPELSPLHLQEVNATPPVHDYEIDRDKILGEPDPEYDEFLRRMDQEPEIPPEQLPHRTVLGRLGYNVRGGEHPDVLLKDAKLLRAKSIVYVGNNLEWLQKVRADTEMLRDDKGKRIPIITRFRAPHDSYDIAQHMTGLLNTMKAAKHNLAPDKSLADLEKDPSLVIEILNEPNLYQSTADIQNVVDGFVIGAKEARANGFTVLIPPMAPHTPYDSERFPHGNEMEYYDKFLHTLRKHKDFESIKDAFELSVHAYVRHENENPFPRIREIYEKVQRGLGLDLPIHITEFGISRDFLESHDDVAGAVEVARLVNLSIPTNLSMIKTINFWTMQATSPESDRSESGEIKEDYSKQALRNDVNKVNVKYKALLHGFKTRLLDIYNIHNQEVLRSRTDY
jgi:hypothetical protein